jgi:hypothetical protein
MSEPGSEDSNGMAGLFTYHSDSMASVGQPPRERAQPVLWAPGLRRVVLGDEKDVHRCQLASELVLWIRSRISKVARVTATISSRGQGWSPLRHASVKASNSVR